MFCLSVCLPSILFMCVYASFYLENIRTCQENTHPSFRRPTHGIKFWNEDVNTLNRSDCSYNDDDDDDVTHYGTIVDGLVMQPFSDSMISLQFCESLTVSVLLDFTGRQGICCFK